MQIGHTDLKIGQLQKAKSRELIMGERLVRHAVQAGAVEVLVELLRADPGEIAAELAAVVLRNLALGNAANRQATAAADGLEPLLRLLSMGQDKLVNPMPCEVVPELL